MEPTGDLWSGVGQSVASAEGWMVVGALLVLGALFVIAKYIVPSAERVRMRRLDIEEKRAANEAEGVKVNAAMAENQRQNNENTKALTTVMTALQARLEESASHSREMGGEVAHTRETADHIRDMTDETNSLVKDIHAAVVPRRGEGTD